MNCEKYTELIEKYLNAEINETELDELKDQDVPATFENART